MVSIMVTLNVFGKIEPICISNRLKLYIANLPNDEDNNWNQEVFEELQSAVEMHALHCKQRNLNSKINVAELHRKRCPNSVLTQTSSENNLLQEIVDNMLCVYLDYSYDDMPLGDWETNPFDGRCCEKDYAELLMDFFHFLSFLTDTPVPLWTYSSNFDRAEPYYRFFFSPVELESAIETLKLIGQKIDNFLQTRNDYLQLDYLVRAIHDIGEYNTYHFFKLYSLCQLMLENKHESELDRKLPIFLSKEYSETERNELALIMRQMRNKIAHGDFVAFEKKAEEYAKQVLDDRYDFDYSEYSRKNWVLLNACCQLTDAVKEMLKLLFNNRAKLDQIKKST